MFEKKLKEAEKKGLSDWYKMFVFFAGIIDKNGSENISAIGFFIPFRIVKHPEERLPWAREQDFKINHLVEELKKEENMTMNIFLLISESNNM